MQYNSYAFIGFGLIAGSIARSIRENHPTANIIAFNRSLPSLELAQKEGVLNEYFRVLNDEALSKFGQCEFIFLCAPVEANNINRQRQKQYPRKDSRTGITGSVYRRSSYGRK